MIIMIHPERLNALMVNGREFADRVFKNLGFVDGTQMVVDENLPLEEDDGAPILCYKVDNPKVVLSWNGEPIIDRGSLPQAS